MIVIHPLSLLLIYIVVYLLQHIYNRKDLALAILMGDNHKNLDFSLPVPCSLRASSLVQMILCSLVWL